MIESNKKKILGLVGIARKAGAVTLGTTSTVEAIRTQSPKVKVHLVLIAQDASGNTKKRIKDSSDYYKTNCIEVEITSEQFGHATGKYDTAACIGITDKGFADALEKAVSEKGTEAN